MEPQLKPVPTGNEPFRGWPQAPDTTVAVDQSKVLRNTYWLLALSMLPTIAGAWLGVATGLVRYMSPGISTVIFLVGAYGLMYGINKTKNSSTGTVRRPPRGGTRRRPRRSGGSSPRPTRRPVWSPDPSPDSRSRRARCRSPTRVRP